MRSRKLRPKPTMPSSSSRVPTSDQRPVSGQLDPSSDGDTPGPTTPLKASGLQQMGSAIGGIIAGVENQVFGRPPPGPVLVRHATPSRGKGPDGTEFLLDFPAGKDKTHTVKSTPKTTAKHAPKTTPKHAPKTTPNKDDRKRG